MPEYEDSMRSEQEAFSLSPLEQASLGMLNAYVRGMHEPTRVTRPNPVMLATGENLLSTKKQPRIFQISRGAFYELNYGQGYKSILVEETTALAVRLSDNISIVSEGFRPCKGYAIHDSNEPNLAALLHVSVRDPDIVMKEFMALLAKRIEFHPDEIVYTFSSQDSISRSQAEHVRRSAGPNVTEAHIPFTQDLTTSYRGMIVTNKGGVFLTRSMRNPQSSYIPTTRWQWKQGR